MVARLTACCAAWSVLRSYWAEDDTHVDVETGDLLLLEEEVGNLVVDVGEGLDELGPLLLGELEDLRRDIIRLYDVDAVRV